MPTGERRAALHTVLLVGEGKTDCAFLKYIKSLYIGRGCGVSVKVRNAHGKGPDYMVGYTIGQCNADYDRIAVLLDTDLQMSTATRKRAKRRKIQVIGSTPCIEGLLLKILGKHVPETSAECKGQRGVTLPAQLTRPENYQEHFPRDLLDDRRGQVPELDELLKLFVF